MISVQILPSSRFYDPKAFLLGIDLPFPHQIRPSIHDILLVPISLLVFLPSFCFPLLPTLCHVATFVLAFIQTSSGSMLSISPINRERSSLSRGFSVCVLNSSSSSTSSMNAD